MGSGANNTALSVMQGPYRAVARSRSFGLKDCIARLADLVGADHVVLEFHAPKVQAAGEQLFARVNPVHAQPFRR